MGLAADEAELGEVAEGKDGKLVDLQDDVALPHSGFVDFGLFPDEPNGNSSMRRQALAAGGHKRHLEGFVAHFYVVGIVVGQE